MVPCLGRRRGRRPVAQFPRALGRPGVRLGRDGWRAPCLATPGDRGGAAAPVIPRAALAWAAPRTAFGRRGEHHRRDAPVRARRHARDPPVEHLAVEP